MNVFITSYPSSFILIHVYSGIFFVLMHVLQLLRSLDVYRDTWVLMGGAPYVGK